MTAGRIAQQGEQEWWAASVQLMGSDLWCYVEIKAHDEDGARRNLKRMFRDCVNYNYVERAQ